MEQLKLRILIYILAVWFLRGTEAVPWKRLPQSPEVVWKRFVVTSTVTYSPALGSAPETQILTSTILIPSSLSDALPAAKTLFPTGNEHGGLDMGPSMTVSSPFCYFHVHCSFTAVESGLLPLIHPLAWLFHVRVCAEAQKRTGSQHGLGFAHMLYTASRTHDYGIPRSAPASLKQTFITDCAFQDIAHSQPSHTLAQLPGNLSHIAILTPPSNLDIPTVPNSRRDIPSSQSSPAAPPFLANLQAQAPAAPEIPTLSLSRKHPIPSQPALVASPDLPNPESPLALPAIPTLPDQGSVFGSQQQQPVIGSSSGPVPEAPPPVPAIPTLSRSRLHPIATQPSSQGLPSAPRPHASSLNCSTPSSAFHHVPLNFTTQTLDMGRTRSTLNPSRKQTWTKSLRQSFKGTLTSMGFTTTTAAAPTPTPTENALPEGNIFVPIEPDNILPQIPINNAHPVPRTGIEDSADATLQTNKFYANAFLGAQNQPIWTHPYSIWWGKGQKGAFETWGMNVAHIEESELSYGEGDPVRV